MNELNDVGREPPDPVAIRLAAMERMYAQLSAMIEVALENFGTPQAEMPAAILKKIADLQAAHLKVVAAEDDYHAKFGLTEDDNAANNYDAIRVSIGCMLDRIRDSHSAEPFSGGVE